MNEKVGGGGALVDHQQLGFGHLGLFVVDDDVVVVLCVWVGQRAPVQGGAVGGSSLRPQ